MQPLILVAIGGALGSVARYKLSGWILHHAVSWKFPVGTFAVNVIGCLAAGVLAAVSTRQHLLTADMRVLLFSGVLGGFTTFSAFGLETILLIKRGDFLLAAANVLLSVLVALMVLWLGFHWVLVRDTQG